MRVRTLIFPLIALAVACSGGEPTPERVPEPPTPIIFPTFPPTPTPITFPTPLPTPTPGPWGDPEYLKTLISPLIGVSEPPAHFEPAKNEGDSYVRPDQTSDSDPQADGNTAQAEPQKTPIPMPILPTLAPTPTPKVGIYAVTPPDPKSSGIYPALLDDLSFSVQWTGQTVRKINITASTHTAGYQPTQVQIWQALHDDEPPDCKTEKPIAFIAPGTTGEHFGTANHSWRFCLETGADVIYPSDVPWLYVTEWNWSSNLNTRKRTTEPIVYRWRMSADFAIPEALDLEYRGAEGWRIVVFAGETVVAYLWVDM